MAASNPVISVKKSFYSVEAREKMIKSILNDLDDGVSVDTLLEIWSDYLHANLPSCPWTALWSDNEKNVLVDVVSIDWEDLTARVVVLDSDESHEVPAHQLVGPVPDPGEDEVSVSKAVEALDNFSFFANFLWFPWDDDEDNELWSSSRLNNRLLLWRNSQTDPSSDTHDRLLELGRRYNASLQETKTILDLEDSTDEDLASLCRLENVRADMKKQATLLEDPVLRQAEEMCRMKKKESSRLAPSQTFLVWNGGTWTEANNFVSSASQCVQVDPKAPVLFAASLEEALSAALPADLLILCSGDHNLGEATNDLADFGRGGKLLGISSETIIRVEDPWVLRGNAQSQWTLTDLCITACSTQVTGIIVKGGYLKLLRCHFSGFSTALSLHCGSNLVVEQCTFSDCLKSIHAEPDCEVRVINPEDEIMPSKDSYTEL